jgi:hypothetical protein
MRIGLAAILSIALLGSAGTAWAEGGPDSGRSGGYVGVGGGVAWDFLDAFIEEAAGGLVGIDAGGSFNARAGYRVVSWFAVEGMYEGSYRMSVIEALTGSEIADSNFHSLLANLKFILPIKRFQPYIAIGGGAQYGEFAGRGVLAGPKVSGWDPVIRVGLGLDLYLNEHWLINSELAPAVRLADWGDIPSALTDNVTLTLSFGAQYRF